MLHTLHTIVAVGGIAVFAVFLFGFLMKYAAHRLLRQGLFFTLVCCGFLHSMATKPEPEPEPEPTVTNRVEFVLGDCLVRTGGGELVQLVEQGGGAVAPEVAPVPGYRFDSWSRPFDVVTEDMTVTGNVEKLVYPIVYSDTRGAENTNPASYTVTDAFVFAPLADVEGYTFDGWDPAEVTEGTVGDLTVTAQWTEVEPEPEPEPTVKFTYDENGDGTITLTGVKGDVPDGELVVPSSYAGKPVVGIGTNFLEKTSGITSLVVPEGVRYIGREAFHEIDTLSRVSLPSTLEKVDEKAFGDCYKLATITVADGNDDVNVVNGVLCDFNQRRAIVGVNGITALTLPAGITRIGKQAFCACTKLVTADLSASGLISMAKNAFAGCTSLTTVRFPTTFLLSEDKPFLMCAKLKEVCFLGAEPTVIGDFYRLDEDDDSKLVPATTFVRLGQGWSDVPGEWQGRPIAYEDAKVVVTTAFCPGSEGLGTVSGGGVTVEPETVVTLKATAASKNCVFAGWFYDEAGTESAEGENDCRSTSFQFVAGYADVCLYAKFLPVSGDYCGEIIAPEANGDGVPEGAIRVLSGSLPTVTVSGLPAGLTFDKKTGELVFNKAKMKGGDYAFVISAKNTGGYKNDRVVTFVYGEVEELDTRYRYTVGKTVEEPVDANVTGLPTGLKCVKTTASGETTYTIAGTPTKAGRFKAKEAGETYYILVQGAPSKYVEVSADGLPAGCKATGSGVYAAGAKATLKATAAKGYVFAGWYSDYDFETPVSCDADYRNPTLTIADISSANDVYYPRFIELKYDYCGEIGIAGWEEYDEGVPEGTVLVASASLPAVTVSGLPTGMVYDKKTGEIVVNCWDKLKTGSYAFVISAKNAGGYKNDRVMAFTYVREGEDEPIFPDDWWTQYAVGQIVDESCDPEPPDEISDVISVTMSGLPAGLKLVKCEAAEDEEDPSTHYCLKGMPTKPGRYAVVCTFTGYSAELGTLIKAVKPYYMTVQGAPSRYVEVVADGPAGCKVTGSGVYAAGATIKTSATAAKGHVFSGWYAEFEPEEGPTVTNAFCNGYAEYLGKDGDYRLAAQTWLCGKFVCEEETVDMVPAVLIGRFVANGDDALDDDSLRIVTDEGAAVDKVWDVFISQIRKDQFPDEEGVTSAGIVVSVDSVSYPKLTVKGSIAGIAIKNYGSYVTLAYDPSGTKMPKPGEYALTFTASNQSKSTVARTLTVRVPNVVDEEWIVTPYYGPEGAFYNGEGMSYSVGETVNLSAVAVFGEAPDGSQRKITLSGLPAGVKAAGTDGSVAGVPTKAGCYVVNVAVKYWNEDEAKWLTTAATVYFRVEPIDTSCVGTFNGELADWDGNPIGTFSATVSAAGKLTSCKLIDLKGKSTPITLQTQEFSNRGDYYRIDGKDKGGNERTFEIYPAIEGEDPSVVQLGGTMEAALGDYGQAAAQQNVWSDKAYKSAGMLPNFPSRGVAPDEWDDDLELLFKPSGAVPVKRNGKSGSARFELSAYSAVGGWIGTMTVNVPDGTDTGYCRTFGVAVSADLKVSEIGR